MSWAEVQQEFNKKIASNKALQNIINKKNPTYTEANKAAVIIGDTLGKTLATKENFPDGISFAEASELLNPALNNNYDIVKKIAKKAQDTVYQEAGLNIKAVTTKPKADLIPGLAKEISDRGSIDGFEQTFAEQIGRFTMEAIDDTVSVNAYNSDLLGLSPKIVRTSEADCCEWCSDLEGEYTLEEAEALGVYSRHSNCRCSVEYVVNNTTVNIVHNGREGITKYGKSKTDKRIETAREAEANKSRQKQIDFERRIANDKLNANKKG